MKILSITTSSPICGVAILENVSPINEIILNNGLTHSQTLMPTIVQILEKTHLTLKDFDLIVADIGPGSFTGIRIGVSTLKAFADSLKINAIGVSSLDALSYNVNSTSKICSLIDAKSNNVYCQIFENKNNSKIPQPACFKNIDDFLFDLQKSDLLANITFVGNGSIIYKEKILNYFPNSNFSSNNDISAVNIGIAGFYNYTNNNFFELSPLYLKRSDAEKKLEENQNGN